MQIVDSQVHLWEAHRPDRPWPQESLAEKSFVAVPGARPHREQPLGAEELLATMDACGVQRAIIVPPSPVGDQNATGLEAAARYPQRFAVMGRFDPTEPGAAERLEGWLGQRGMLGIRMTFHKPQWSGWLEPGAIDWFWAACERLRIPLMVLVPGKLDKIAWVAARHPELRIVLDHFGRRSDLRDDAAFADLDLMLALARFPNVAVKVSSAPCYSTQAFPFRNLAPYLRRIHDAFGARRQLWGTDWTRLPCSYLECLDHYRHELPFLTAQDKEWILGGSALEILNWR